MGRLRVAGLVLIAMFASGLIAAGTAAASQGGRHHVGHKGQARPSAKKAHPEVWTLTELKNGQQHKLKAGTAFFGKVKGSIYLTEKRVNYYEHEYEWIHPLVCQESSVYGVIKSNSVAKPEIELQGATGEINAETADCTEEGRPQDEWVLFEEPTFEYWGQAEVKVLHFPWTVRLEQTRYGTN